MHDGAPHVREQACPIRLTRPLRIINLLLPLCILGPGRVWSIQAKLSHRSAPLAGNRLEAEEAVQNPASCLVVCGYD